AVVLFFGGPRRWENSCGLAMVRHFWWQLTSARARPHWENGLAPWYQRKTRNRSGRLLVLPVDSARSLMTAMYSTSARESITRRARAGFFRVTPRLAFNGLLTWLPPLFQIRTGKRRPWRNGWRRRYQTM